LNNLPKLLLYRAMAGVDAITPEELASKTGIDARLRVALAQAAGRAVTYDTVTKSFTLPDEQAFGSAVPDSPALPARSIPHHRRCD
jgi:hypothetical protein